MYTNLNANLKTIIKLNASFYNALNVKFDYQNYKLIAYGNINPSSIIDIEMKNLFDEEMYLLSNKSKTIDHLFIRKCLSIIEIKEDENNIQSIIDIIYEISSLDLIGKTTDIIIKLNNLSLSSNDRINKTFSLLFGLYYIYRDKEFFISLNLEMIKKLFISMERNDFSTLYEDINAAYFNTKKKPKSYYKNLKELSVETIFTKINKDRDFIVNEYKIESISLFGSFSKNTNRIDSDIDLLVTIKKGITYLEKEKLLARFKEYILANFKRYADILEYNGTINETLVVEIENAIKIF